MKLAMIYPFLKNDIDKIEQALNQTIQAEHPVLREASTQLLEAGGKRIRPVFVLLAGKFGEYDIERMKDVAVSLELIHMASLVHDDVIDDAELRRGQPTIKAKWDNRIAMYTGDYIFARALECLSNLETAKAHRILSETIVEICIGEIEQIKDKFNWDQNLRTYLRRIRRKTAILIAVSCRLGAVAAGASLEVERALFRYGYYVGMSYQIIDDVLDFTSTEKELGKPAGSDLMQGNITLPVLYAMQQDSNLRQDYLESLENEEASSEQMQHIITRIKDTGAIKQSLAISEKYLHKAFTEIEVLPDQKEKQTLRNIAKYIGKRKS
ncbi:heptaprenyl diphosphate synthase component II [Pontibacillus yanchengensis]|uniref:Heptaprenyl diphosphate synthase component II n=2 Tax=Pontibacillus yanchengensis TaxID=462910 RepID=A0ACC7VLR5_9BACI|nr:heptaprenyl diphosphate synthase component II [Pontibacillus yanchengensis]MYL32745.1 heptaprenyl diphosphate synthase component II [Pontibacillus yanchengensis]MYL55139.1 heptaprenyl diphosphate synthase component II [Pontibacillus yanchengensis]